MQMGNEEVDGLLRMDGSSKVVGSSTTDSNREGAPRCSFVSQPIALSSSTDLYA